ncbi:MAG: AAA family ATPase [Candidatus Micrarchaeia archaeon]
MQAIILCGFPACGKTTVAGLLASRLKVQVLGGTDMLREIAKERGYKPVGLNWWDTPEGVKFLRERASDPQFDMEVDNRLIERVKQGDVVVTSYTLPWLTDFGFKVWLEASVETRAKRMAARDNISVDEAKKVLEIRDTENRELYEKLYGIHFGSDTSPFDLVIDVEKISAEEAAARILSAFGKSGTEQKQK